jgi:hypothetical protein
MAATTYDSLVGFVAVDTPDAPYPLIVSTLNMAARQLCVQSACWNDWIEIPLEAGVSEYDVSAPTSGSIVSNIKYLTLGSKKITPATTQTLLGNQDWAVSAAGEPRFYNVLSDMTLKIYPNPSQSEVGKSMNAYCTFMPTVDSTSVPSKFIERYAETLINGAKAKLMSMPNKTWTDMANSGVYESRFMEGITKARIEVASDYTSVDLTANKLRFGQ